MPILNYNICKKLKNAGFQLKQPHPLSDVVSCYTNTKTGEEFIEPSLSALIDASLQNFTLDCQPWGDSGSARGFIVCPEGGKDMKACSSAEEAVARLILQQLNED